MTLYSATTNMTPTSTVTVYNFTDSVLNISGVIAGYYTGYIVIGSTTYYLKLGQYDSLTPVTRTTHFSYTGVTTPLKSLRIGVNQVALPKCDVNASMNIIIATYNLAY